MASTGPVKPRKPDAAGKRCYRIPHYTEEEIKSFDNSKNSKPPPYKYACKPLLKGLEIGDPLYDCLPTSSLACHGVSKKVDELPTIPEPAWVDWESVRRGQELWQFHLGKVFSALGGELLAGFNIARFVLVLHKNGYAQSGETAMQRYMHTGFAIVDWYTHDLSDPKSRARQSLLTVRAMHAFARRNSKDLFDREAGEGIPLSQYDMAEVQLGFTVVCIDIIENELGYGNMHRHDVRDMVHCWRLIGYHLGILDEYNVCNSVDQLDDIMADYMAFTPRRFECFPEASEELRRTAIEGFAMTTGLGTNFWYAVVDRMYSTPRMEMSHLRPEPEKQKFLPGVDAVIEFGMVLMRNIQLPFLDTFTRKNIIAQREEYLDDNPSDREWRAKVTRNLSIYHDKIAWPVVSILYRVRVLVLISVLLRFWYLVKSRFSTYLH